MEEEIWKPIKDYEGLYEVSNLGRVKSLNYNRTGEERILKPYKNKRNYLKVNLSKNGKCKQFLVHRLVAETFIPNPDNKPEVDHIIPVSMGGTDEASNLRWVSSKENSNNELTKEHYSEAKKGKILSEETKKKMSEAHKGKNNTKAKKVYCIELDKVFNSIKEASEELNFNSCNICLCCKGKQKTCGGYHFKYYIKEEVA